MGDAFRLETRCYAITTLGGGRFTMPFYTSTEQNVATPLMSVFFERVGKEFPHAGLRPQAENDGAGCPPSSSLPACSARWPARYPLKTHIGAVPFRPYLDIEMPADMLHAILNGQTSIRSGLASGKLRSNP